MIYLDHNATSPLLPQARAAWLEAEERFPGNPSSPHRLGARAAGRLEQAQQRLATILGCSPFDLIWTSGATEACNAALHHAAATAAPGAPVWVSAIEHPATLESARHNFGAKVEVIPVNADGVVEPDWVSNRLSRQRPALVAVMAASNETGVLQPWREIQVMCAAQGVRFFCDATQWCGRLAAAGLGACDLLAGSAHKFGGPRGVGFLKANASAVAQPLLHGGQQQGGRRAGTENVAGVVALLAALEWCEAQIAAGGAEPIRARREEFERELVAQVPGASVSGVKVERLWNTVSVVMPEADCRQRWVVKLDKSGFAVSTGSACASGSERPSHVLTAMGLTAAEAGRALRFSAGWLTPPSVWEELLRRILQIQREIAPLAGRTAG